MGVYAHRKAVFSGGNAETNRGTNYLTYVSSYLKLVNTYSQLSEAMRPLLRQYGVYTGTGSSHQAPEKFHHPRPMRLYHASVAARSDAQAEVQLVPSPSSPGHEKDNLLVLVSGARPNSSKMFGSFILPHTFTVHDAWVAEPSRGECSEALVTLKPGQTLTIHQLNGTDRVEHSWNGRMLTTVVTERPARHDTRDDDIVTPDAINIREAIALRQLTDNQAIQGVSTLIDLLRASGLETQAAA